MIDPELWVGFANSLTMYSLMLCAAGALIGTIVGLIPGLGPINGLAIMLPIAYGLKIPADGAMMLLASVYLGAEYGGRISAILINIPGDAGAIMTTIDGYPMAQRGQASEALSLSALSSFVGTLCAWVGVVLFAPWLAKLALAVGPAEYFALMIFALVAVTAFMDAPAPHTILMMCLGLGLSSVGIDATSGTYRFDFGLHALGDGLSYTALIIGLFSITEAMVALGQISNTNQKIAHVVQATRLFTWSMLKASMVTIVRSSGIGFFVGVLPGAGATIASAISYSTTKFLHHKKPWIDDRVETTLDGNKHQDRIVRFGEGDPRGVAAPESANSASACGSFVPLLTLGIPGSGTTAVMLGALTLYNINPGPMLFQEESLLVWSLLASLFITNVMLLVLNVPLIGLFIRFLMVPRWALFPLIAAVSSIGVYSIYGNSQDLTMMMIFGLLGYILRLAGLPMAPLLLGFVLGNLIEQNFRRAMSISGGDPSILLGQPFAIGIWTVTFALIAFKAYSTFAKRKAA